MAYLYKSMYKTIKIDDFAEINSKALNRRFQRFFDLAILPYLESTNRENPNGQ